MNICMDTVQAGSSDIERAREYTDEELEEIALDDFYRNNFRASPEDIEILSDLFNRKILEDRPEISKNSALLLKISEKLKEASKVIEYSESKRSGIFLENKLINTALNALATVGR